MRNTAGVTGGKSIAVLLQSISGVSAINPLVAFYDIHEGPLLHGRIAPLLFFYFVPDTPHDYVIYLLIYLIRTTYKTYKLNKLFYFQFMYIPSYTGI
jgi:hypothetical protein